MDFSGKTAISTGAASGMGFLFAKEFASCGGNVVLCDINEDSLKKSSDEINKTCKGKAIYAVCDVRDYGQITESVEKAVENFGSVDFLCNFAGGAETRMLDAKGAFFEVPPEVYEWGIDVNLKGQLYFDHAVLKQMVKQKSGVIINIGSITGAEGCARNVAYSASKSGVMDGLTKSVALAGAPYGIRCNCISPGPVLTRASMSEMKTLMGRAANPCEIVDFIMYVISDKASFLNGENILIDGGRLFMRDKN